MKIRFDHAVIAASDPQKTAEFYGRVLGAQIVARKHGFALKFDDFQLNCHVPPFAAQLVARVPVAPGGADVCFEWVGTLEEAQHHLRNCGVAIELGPIERIGARGAGQSLYFRDPDGALLEFIVYAQQ